MAEVEVNQNSPPLDSAENLSLRTLLDLSLGTPEPGAVNFNALHTLLAALLTKLDLNGMQIPASSVAGASKALVPAGAGVGVGLGISSTTTTVSVVGAGMMVGGLEAKVKALEDQLKVLNSLPKNPQLLDAVGIPPISLEAQGSPVTYMFQILRLQKNVDTNTTGIDKLMSLVDELIRDLRMLRESSNDLKRQIARLSELDALKELSSRLNSIDQKIGSLQMDMDQGLRSLSERLSGYSNINPEQLEQFVTWKALDDALLGMRRELESMRPQQPVIQVIESATMTERGLTPPPRGPSPQLLEVLDRLGQIADKFDQIEKRIAALEEEVKRKANREEVSAIQVPDISSLIKQLNEVRKKLEEVRSTQDKDSGLLRRLQELLVHLQDESQRLRDTTQFLDEENRQKTENILNLDKFAKDLEDRKADKSQLQMELEPKADRSMLDAKVSLSQFDRTTEQLNGLIQELLDKLSTSESDFKNLLDEYTRNLEGKLERGELEALRRWIETKMKQLQKLVSSGRATLSNVTDEAAGLRKQLIQRFHCISCDRPIEVGHSTMPPPNLPEAGALPSVRSSRPYTTYELDAIRQQARRGITGDAEMLGGALGRAAGGGHTLTFPHKRFNKLAALSQLADEQAAESWLARLYSGEFELAGSDGRFYKGRVLQPGERASDVSGSGEDFKLPPLRQGAMSATVAVPGATPTERDRDSGTESGGDTGNALAGGAGDMPQSARVVKSSRVRQMDRESSGRPVTVATSEPRSEEHPPNDDD